ncbi:unnamed protein product [Orchesella dallaii]|uniref:Uncharacterized protein n=1 Tax=Orchesella dallaii TaxID=48710 RepID=A0ABP1PU64_9HEXA
MGRQSFTLGCPNIDRWKRRRHLYEICCCAEGIAGCLEMAHESNLSCNYNAFRMLSIHYFSLESLQHTVGFPSCILQSHLQLGGKVFYPDLKLTNQRDKSTRHWNTRSELQDCPADIGSFLASRQRSLQLGAILTRERGKESHVAHAN